MAKDDLKDEIGFFTAMPERVIEMWRTIGTYAVALFLYLRYRTNKNRGCAWPSYSDIQQNTGMRRETIADAIKVLEGAGLLERTKRFGASTMYVLKIPEDPLHVAVASSPAGGLLEGEEDTSVVRQVDYSSPTGGPSVVRQVDGIQDLRIQDLNTQDLKGSRSQNLWLHVLSIISEDYYRYNPLGPRSPDFLKYWQPTELLEQTPLMLKIACIGEDPEFQSQWLTERKKIAEHALTGITGKRLEIEFVPADAPSQ
jgi:hypothetical protein